MASTIKLTDAECAALGFTCFADGAAFANGRALASSNRLAERYAQVNALSPAAQEALAVLWQDGWMLEQGTWDELVALAEAMAR